MKAIVALLAILLFALPGFAQSSVDNCCQVGRACATDAEWIQGWNDYQAGQCPASAPAASSQPAASQPAATTAVDNCCQVGRACATDADWTQGWFDFQAGQCPVSAPAASSQPAASQPAATTAVDNCCQVGRACATDADWTQGWHDFQAGQCPVSAPAGSSQPAASSPPAATTTVNNCCQVGRACSTDADWVQGYNDYQAGQCDASSTSSMSNVSLPNNYSFSGTGRAATGVFTLTRGKWRFNPGLGRAADTFLIQVSSVGQANVQGTCLSFPTNWHYTGQSGAGLRLAPQTHEFVVRYQCDAQFVVFPEAPANEVSGQSWKIFIQKTDGNI